MTRIELGAKGEDIAEQYLRDAGYKIVKRNCRVRHSDIDVLASRDDTLVFVEVRTKSNSNYGMPEESITKTKLRQMKKTAEIYLAFHEWIGSVRMDAICIILEESGKVTHFQHYSGVG